MIPLGWLCIKVAKRSLRVPRAVLMPIILLFCVVGSFAINNTGFDVAIMLIAGVVAWPIATTLGVLTIAVWLRPFAKAALRRRGAQPASRA